MKEETEETRGKISFHHFNIQLAIEEYWDYLAKAHANHEISERRYNHLKTFPQRFTDYELKEIDNVQEEK